ncbi:N-acetyltransferase family protein [Sporolactobacillus sp. STCC-11]|uniref:GNAT family N-acetyltransferase n=1 Tax=Sporolactobacillus caesalpiniae TaxID=3230362 RepID=UPI00339B6780
MADHIVYREAQLSDLPIIVAIYNSTIPGRMVTADTEEVTVSERKPWFSAHYEDKNRPLWVAEQDGKICGWLSLSSFYGRPAYRATVEISVYLDTSVRGKGLGTDFVTYAIDHCHEFGIKTILAFIFGHNIPSLRLFERLGFEKWGAYPKVAELDSIERDLVILGKRVNE